MKSSPTSDTVHLLRSQSLVGMPVHNALDEDLGQLEEVVIDLKNGTIAYAVLSFGGFLGLANKLFAIPWQAFEMSPHSDSLVLNIAKEALKKAPGFDKDQWPNVSEPEWRQSIARHYGNVL